MKEGEFSLKTRGNRVLKKSLTSGTKPMAKKSLLYSELLSIIGVSKKFGVSELRTRDFHIIFREASSDRVLAPKVSKKILRRQEAVAKEALIQDELATKEDRLYQMQIEDPAQAEELLLSGELEE